jgi:hypothetical protein
MTFFGFSWYVPGQQAAACAVPLGSFIFFWYFLFGFGFWSAVLWGQISRSYRTDSSGSNHASEERQ